MVKSHILISVLILQLFSCHLAQKMKFNADGKFKILQLSDLHYGEGSSNDQNNMRIQQELIDKVQPDMVVVTGDTESGYAYDGQPDFQQNAWSQFTTSFELTQTYYAFAIGNHDAYDGGLDPHLLHDLELACDFSLLGHNVNNSYNNFTYYVPIYSSFNESEVAAMSWQFDSHWVGCGGEENSWGCIEANEIEWYKNVSKEIDQKSGRDIHHLGFFHIPLPEVLNLYNSNSTTGNKNEPVSCPLVNTGVFDAFQEVGNLQAIFVGHDHNNDFSGFYKGIELVYARKTGYGGYGPLPGFSRGGRVIELTETLQPDGTVKVTRDHYIVLEDETQENYAQQEQYTLAGHAEQDACPLLGDSACYHFSEVFRDLIGIYDIGYDAVVVDLSAESM